jgi:hypothetical protein
MDTHFIQKLPQLQPHILPIEQTVLYNISCTSLNCLYKIISIYCCNILKFTAFAATAVLVLPVVFMLLRH